MLTNAISRGFVCTANATTLTAVFVASAMLATRFRPTELTAPVWPTHIYLFRKFETYFCL